MSQSSAALSDSWSLLYIPVVTPEMISECNNNYSEAVRRVMKKIDTMDTVEKVCSFYNSLPKLSLFPKNETIVFARKDVMPSTESFSSDALKISIDSLDDSTNHKTAKSLLMMVLGDYLSERTGENTCRVVRIAHRPSMKFKDSVRFEVWLDKPQNQELVEKIFKEVLVDCQISTKNLQY